MVSFSTDRPYLPHAVISLASHSPTMLTEIYFEALLVDDELADQVWEAWDAGEINDVTAWVAWVLVLNDHGLYRVQKLSP